MTSIRDYQKTHKKLLHSGLILFLDMNFETTSVRQICKLADVTTGAFYKHFTTKHELLDELVTPYLIALKDVYNSCTLEFQLAANDEITQNTSVENVKFLKNYWEKNSNELEPVIDYMYHHSDITKLVLFKAEGSKYDNILENVTNFSETQVWKTLHWLEEKNVVTIKLANDNHQLHFYIYSYLATVFDILMHEYSLEETKALLRDLYSFMTPAWMRYLFDINSDI